MTFAKLENDRLVRCPKTGKVDGKTHSNLPLFFEKHPDKALLNGWKELVETEAPGANYYAAYAIKNGKVVQEWIEIPEAEPFIDLPAKNRADIDYIAMMTDVDLEDS